MKTFKQLKIAFLLLLALQVLLYSCEKSNQSFCQYEERNMELNLKNQDSIQLWCRSTCSFKAVYNGEYSIESQDTSIVKVCEQQNCFTVKSINPGSTNIVISNCFGDRKVLKCHSCKFRNYWSETPELSRIYKNTLMVVAEDKKIAEIIRTELKPTYLNRGHEYKFIEGTNKMTVSIPTQGAPITGTYDFDVANQALTLNYGNNVETYCCDIQPPYPNLFLYQPHFIVALKQDLTEKYLSKYPNAGISDVYVIRHIIALSDYWIIDEQN